MIKSFFVYILSLFLWHNTYAQQIDTVSVYFDIAVPILDVNQRYILDSLAYKDLLPTTKQYGVIGYADYLGTDTTNQTLSENRAKNVKDYLQTLGIKQDSIQLVIGKGTIEREIKNGKEGYRADRRVDIVIGGFKVSTIEKDKSLKGKLARQKVKQQRLKQLRIEQLKDYKPEPRAVEDLPDLEVGDIAIVNNLNFQPARHYLLESATPTLERLGELMQLHPNLKISIEGHICCAPFFEKDGWDQDTRTWDLSVNRAKYIYGYLIEHYNIEPNRMTYRGYGFNRPLVLPEITEEDKTKNRRVEIRILAK